MTDNLRAAAQAALETLEDVFGKDKIDVSAINNLRAALVEPEPVAWLVTYGGLTHVEYTQPTQVVDTHYQPLYAAPPRREWVGLTDDEVYRIAFELEGEHWRKITDAIEALLKEKNK